MTQNIRALIAAPLLMALLIGTTASAYAQSAAVDISADAAVDVGTSENTEDTSTPEDTTTDTAQTEEPTVRLDTTSGFSLRKGDASVENSTGAVVAADSVNTQSDLEAYAAATLSTSDRIAGVDATADTLALRFNEEAKLFGFIPLTMTSRVEVAADGSVRVLRPWYSFLASGVHAETNAAIEARVRQALEGESTLSARAQARVIAEIAQALGEGSAAANADARGSAGTEEESTTNTGTIEGTLEVAPY